MADVTFIVDGKTLTAPAGTLLIDACRKAGIDIPAFCYYPGLSLQAACRMCVVRQEKVPKLQTACTTTVAEGQVFITESDEIAQARKATLELLLGNHPLDCPVCDKGGECELQDMTFKYGAGESLYAEAKQHRDEQQWSPAVYFDRPRCILCYRCIRVCGEGMDVWALGVQGRGVSSSIAPNGRGPGGEGRLDCEQCGMCIDVCPVGALTSGSYRYKTRPWEMNHVSTVCTHCADGCKVTLGVRQTNDGSEIVRANNRDKSGINGDFLCAKGRFGFDFAAGQDRLTHPLVRSAEGKLEPATWEAALRLVAEKLKEVREGRESAAIGVIGSNQSTNEENYLLQKFARTVRDRKHQPAKILHPPRVADFAGLFCLSAGRIPVANFHAISSTADRLDRQSDFHDGFSSNHMDDRTFVVLRGRGTILPAMAAAVGLDWIERKRADNFLHLGNFVNRRPNLPRDKPSGLRRCPAAGVSSFFSVVFVSELFRFARRRLHYCNSSG